MSWFGDKNEQAIKLNFESCYTHHVLFKDIVIYLLTILEISNNIRDFCIYNWMFVYILEYLSILKDQNSYRLKLNTFIL